MDCSSACWGRTVALILGAEGSHQRGWEYLDLTQEPSIWTQCGEQTLGGQEGGSGKGRDTSYEVTAHLAGGEGRGLWHESSGAGEKESGSGSMLKAELSGPVGRPHVECERKVRVKQEET